jgi:hypothetical protein
VRFFDEGRILQIASAYEAPSGLGNLLARLQAQPFQSPHSMKMQRGRRVVIGGRSTVKVTQVPGTLFS